MDITTYGSTKAMLLSTPLPKETRTYKPVSNAQLIDLTLDSIVKAGFTLETETYSSAREGRVSNGKFTIKDVADSEMQLQIGWQNSYDKSLSLKFAIGTKIFICSNGSVSGDYGAFKKKHMGEVKEFAPLAIVDYIKRAGDSFKKMQEEREYMKTIEIDRKIQAELIGRMIIEEQFIESTQLNIIKGELDSPTHLYGAPNSLWELYQFTTFSMKEIHPTLWMNNHIKAHTFFTKASGVITTKTPEFEMPIANQIVMFPEL
tara:strand:+ start:31993 stop:32772 length:780 start_codon:yes stop_codon:yes gene_type:complete